MKSKVSAMSLRFFGRCGGTTKLRPQPLLWYLSVSGADRNRQHHADVGKRTNARNRNHDVAWGSPSTDSLSVLDRSDAAGAVRGLCGTVVGNSLVSYLGYKGILLRIPGMTAPVHIYPRLSLGYTAFMILVSACGAVLAALWPAIRASALRPVQALTAV